MLFPIVDLGRKRRGFQKFMWYQGKGVDPLISAERATENRQNIGHSAALLSSGLLVTLLYQGRGPSWEHGWQQGGEVVQSDRTDK